MKPAWPAGLLLLLIFAAPAWSRTWLTDSENNPVLEFKAALAGSRQASPGDSSGSADFWRLRLEPTWKPGADISLSAAWDCSSFAQYRTSALSLLPSLARHFFRITEAGFSTGQGAQQSQQFLDRAWIAYQPEGFSLILGRQAIGWGRGNFFSAVDLFAPFSPLELDREWRPGVDALQADVQVADRLALGCVIAAGSDPLAAGSSPDWNDSAVAARVHGTVFSLDGELIAGRRGADRVVGCAGSLPAWGAEVHAEAAVFLTPGDIPDAGMFGNRDWVPKFVLGASNHFAWGNGLDLALEYHYSGFGVADPAQLPERLADPAYQARYLRGDSQIPGKAAVSLQASYSLTEFIIASGHLLQSLTDSSGVLAPAVQWNFAENVTLVGSGVWAYGAPDALGRPQSQYGGTPLTWIMQVRLYD